MPGKTSEIIILSAVDPIVYRICAENLNTKLNEALKLIAVRIVVT